MIVFLDSGVIGILSNPNKNNQVIACENWLYSLLAKSVYVVSSDICDYEVSNLDSQMLNPLRCQPIAYCCGLGLG